MVNELFAAALAGNQAAIERVLEDVRPVAVQAAERAARSFGPARFDCEDYAQKALCDAWKILASGSFEGSYADFVLRVRRLAANAHSKGHRAAKAAKRSAAKEQAMGELVLAGRPEADSVEISELVALLMQEAARDDLDRVILRGVRDGYSINEIGELAGITGGQVAGRYKRIKERAAALNV